MPTTKAKTAFVMSGGANRGALETGALLALFQAGIVPDILVGTSAGAINAAYIAADPTEAGARALAELWSTSRREDFFPGGKLTMLWRALRGRSLFSSEGLRRALQTRLPHGVRRFGDLKGVQLYITAANLNTGTLYLYGDDPDTPLVDAILASAAHPLAYPPIRAGVCQLVDGGVVANVPVSIAVEKGATEIYILNVGYCGELTPVSSTALGVLMRSITMMMYQHFLMDLRHVLENTDVVLHHISIRGFQDTSMWDLSHEAEMVELGRRSAEEYLKQPLGLATLPAAAFGPAAQSDQGEEPPPPGAQVYTPAYLRPSDMLSLPPEERRVATYLLHSGEADPATIAQDLGWEISRVRLDLASLARKGYLRRLPDGKARLVLGSSRPRTLPNELWDALSDKI